MRQQSLPRLIAVLSVVWLSGCATWTNWTAPKTATLQNVQNDLQYAQMKTRDSRAALEELLVADRADIPAAYRAFNMKLNLMEGAGSRLVRNADGLRHRGSSYLVEAETSAGQCSYPRLSKNARMPGLVLGDAFDPIAEQSSRVQRAFRAYESDLLAVSSHLSGQLNEQEVRDVEMFIRKGESDAENLSYALDQAMVAVDRAKAAYDKTTREKEASKAQGQPIPQGQE